MTSFAHKYYFDESVPAQDIVDTFLLAMLAVESLYDRSRAREESKFTMDEAQRTCAIEASTEVGSALDRIFAGYATKEYGELLVKTERFFYEDKCN